MMHIFFKTGGPREAEIYRRILGLQGDGGPHLGFYKDTTFRMDRW